MNHDKAIDAGQQVVRRILNAGVDGVGPFKGAIVVADEVLKSAGGDTQAAVAKACRMHVRLAGTTGFVTGVGGIAALPVALPVGVGGYYMLGARLAATIAHLNGHDVHSEDVRTAVLVVMLGGAGTEVLREAGVVIGQKSLAAALKKVPGKIFIEINKKVGFRLVTKAGEKGVINMSKLVPLIGGPIGGTIDAASMKVVAKYARDAFPPVTTSGL